jgi:hypothetical protein
MDIRHLLETPDLWNKMLTIAIAAFVAIVGVLQWTLSIRKFRYDLYNRRLDIYVSVVVFYRRLIGDLKDTNPTTQEIRDKFFSSMLEAQFLFDRRSGIYELLAELDYRSFNMIYLKSPDERPAFEGEYMVKQSTTFTSDLNWINDAMPKLAIRMAPYLTFGDSWYARLIGKGKAKQASKLQQQTGEIYARLRTRHLEKKHS